MNKDIPNHAVKAVIKDSEGKILFLQRNPAKGAVPNWDFPGGIVEAGEDDKVALNREIQEELGLSGIVRDELGKWTFYRPFDGKTVEVTNYSVDLEPGDIELSDEHIGFQWFDFDHIKDLPVKDPSLHNALGV